MELELEPITLPGIEDKRPLIIAGPCSAETEEQVMSTAKQLADKGIKLFRAGIWKPRTKPGGFEGVGVDGLAWLKEVKKKTGMYVSTEVAAAVAAGIVAGDPEKQLEVIAQVTPEQTGQMKQFMETVPIEVEHLAGGCTFDIIVTVYHGEDYAKVRIANYHTNIVLIEKNGEVLRKEAVSDDSEDGLTDRTLLDMEHIWDFATTVDVNDVKEILNPQIAFNVAIAEEGLKNDYGANIGKVLLDMDGDDVRVYFVF